MQRIRWVIYGSYALARATRVKLLLINVRVAANPPTVEREVARPREVPLLRAEDKRQRACRKKGPSRGQAFCIGAGEESRTPDLRITNALLYQLSYAGVCCNFL